MVTLFSTNCPRCKVLETKLKNANIDFQINSDVTEVIDAGFMSAPVLKIDETYYDFADAVKWVDNYEN